MQRNRITKLLKVGGLIGAAASAISLFMNGQVPEAIGVATAALSSAGVISNGQ